MADLKVYASIIEDGALRQIETLASHPAFDGAKIRIMPDAHAGIGCVIGFTADLGSKVVPNLVGVDIGCGMLAVNLLNMEVDFNDLDKAIRALIPSGKNVHSERIARFPELSDMFCFRELRDTKRIERSIGTLGGGNHFIEIDRCDDGEKYLVVHTGSRNLGKQVAEYYQQVAIDLSRGKDELFAERERVISSLKAEGRKSEIQSELKRLEAEFDLTEPSISPELAYLEGEWRERYLHDMRICQRFASLNREAIADRIIKHIAGGMSSAFFPSFETVHNYIGDDNVIRKGAISAYEGQTVLIPLNMRDGSIIGRGKGNADWNNSAPHGAGRIMSRRKAKEMLSLETFKDEMEGVFSSTVCAETIDEAPGAYKPSDVIVESLAPTLECMKRIKPVYNFKAVG